MVPGTEAGRSAGGRRSLVVGGIGGVRAYRRQLEQELAEFDRDQTILGERSGDPSRDTVRNDERKSPVELIEETGRAAGTKHGAGARVIRPNSDLRRFDR